MSPKRRSIFTRWLPYVGPAFIAAVAYIDPGNFATNIEGGARFGYRLLWVIAASNLMAMLLQTLAAKLGVATGLNLAEISGLSSSVVGTMAGQIMMQRFLRRHVPIVIRRVVTLAPALVVILLGMDPTKTLVASQVVLRLRLPFAVIPLIVFTARRDVMGTVANHPAVTGLASVCGAIILFLNGLLVVTLFTAR